MSIFNSYQKVLLTFSILILSIGSGRLNAQQAVSSAGGDGTGVGSFSYTFGLVVYTSAESVVDDASIIQGVQIPYEIHEPIITCPTDFNLDGATNILDLSIFLGNFGLPCTGCPTDIDADNSTGSSDLSIFLGSFGSDCPT